MRFSSSVLVLYMILAIVCKDNNTLIVGRGRVWVQVNY